MSVIEYIKCPKCSTLFDVSNIDFLKSKGWVQCGDCTHQFEAGRHAVNHSALLGQSILANMDEMNGKRDFSISELSMDASVIGMANMTVSEGIDLDDRASNEAVNNYAADIYADIGSDNLDSTGSKALIAALAIPLLLTLLLAFVFQLQKRNVVDWIPEAYQQSLEVKWLSFLSRDNGNKIDLAKIHLSSTRMEPHSNITDAKTIVLQLINRANVSQVFPDFEISFTDNNGGVVARRVLKPIDYLDTDQLNMLESKQAKTLRLNLASMPEEAVGYEIQVTRSN